MGKSLLDMCKERFSMNKSIEEAIEETEEKGHKLKRSLNALDVTVLGIGCIIGTGIFVLTGVATAKFAGPSIIFSFLISGFACIFAALCYAELASLIPVSGSAYTYSYISMGELVAWIIGWDLVLEYAVGAIAVAIGWSGYFNEIMSGLGIAFPGSLMGSPFEGGGGVFNVPAFLIVILITALLVVGTKESATFNNIITFVLIIVLIFFVVAGAFYVDLDLFSNFFPYGFGGMMTGAALVFFAYVGFDAISTVAEETKNPQRNLPLGILGSLGVCMVLYIAVALVLVGLAPYDLLAVPAPLAFALSRHGLSWASVILSIGAVAAIFSTLVALLIAQPRIFFSLSRDGLLPAVFSKVHPRFKTPYVTTIITGVTVAVLAGLLPIQTVAELSNIGTLFAFVLVCGGVIILRKTRKDLKRPFKVPLVPLFPLIGAGLCVAMMVSLPLITWFRFIGWLGIGLLIYSYYGYYHSRVGKKHSEGAPRNGK